MKTRRGILKYFLMCISVFVVAVVAAACGKKPDAKTEPSPEWPPKDE